MRDLRFPDPIVRGRDLFDRNEDLATIRTVLRSRARKQIVIIGARLMGKTSLLNVSAEWAEQRGSYVTLKLSSVASRDELAAELVHGIADIVGIGPVQPDLLREVEQFRLSSVARLGSLLRELTNLRPGQRFLLCFDSFDMVLDHCDEAAARQIVNLVVYTIERTSLPIRWLFTIANISPETRSSYSTPYLNTAKMVPLDPWSYDESTEFVNWLIRDRFYLDEAAQRAVFAAAGGQPYFTKAIIRALIDDYRVPAPGAPVTPSLVSGAVESATRSYEIDLTLSSMTKRFSREQVQLLDEASSRLDGLSQEQVASVTGSERRSVDELLQTGYFARDGTRYYLRVGIWKHWRGEQPKRARRPLLGVPDALRTLLGLVGSRWLRGTLTITLTVLALIFGVLWIAYVLPQNSASEVDCRATKPGLRTSLTYPRYVSTGDQARIRIMIANAGQRSQPISVTMLVAFKESAGSRIEVASNRIKEDSLNFGEKRRTDVSFTYTQMGRLLPDSSLHIPFQLRTVDGRLACTGGSWSMQVAPIPRLQLVLRSIVALAAFVMAPLLAGFFQGIFTHPGRQPQPSPDQSRELKSDYGPRRRRNGQ